MFRFSKNNKQDEESSTPKKLKLGSSDDNLPIKKFGNLNYNILNNYLIGVIQRFIISLYTNQGYDDIKKNLTEDFYSKFLEEQKKEFSKYKIENFNLKIHSFKLVKQEIPTINFVHRIFIEAVYEAKFEKINLISNGKTTIFESCKNDFVFINETGWLLENVINKKILDYNSEFIFQ